MKELEGKKEYYRLNNLEKELKNMTRESKLFTANYKAEVSEKIKDYESFGWELLSVNGLDVSMSRNTQNPAYIHLVKYEHEYENLVEQVQITLKSLNQLNYEPIKPGFFLFLIILLIFPAILYYNYKNKQKQEYLKNKSELEERLSELKIKIKQVTNDLRATFFSKRAA